MLCEKTGYVNVTADMDEFWVFGYGSLMWNPGFPYAERVHARAFGYRRALCVHSWVHRGTEREPGLVLGLDRGGSCFGVAFRVEENDRQETLDYLRARELVTNVYLERVMPVVLPDHRKVNAVTYIVDRAHRQYASAMTAGAAATIVRHAAGQSGTNIDYVINTLAHLRDMGIRDHWLEDVADEIDRLCATDAAQSTV